MAQCEGTTRKGERCKRDAREGSAFCAIHQDQEIRAGSGPTDSGEWDRDAIVKAAIGFALIGVIILWGMRK